ncbi:MAG: hypothetical protein NC347_04140 [Clostridium sp.]|nr:hypothetical protein [Clostridium sp.]
MEGAAAYAVAKKRMASIVAGIEQWETNGTNLTAVAKDGTRITITPPTIKGDKGEDGFSPLIKIVQESDGASISTTDKEGSTNAKIYNGGISIDTTYLSVSEDGSIGLDIDKVKRALGLDGLDGDLLSVK